MQLPTSLAASLLVATSFVHAPASAASSSSDSAAGSAPTGRVIVLGFDGADARTAKELMDQGQLPNFARLAKEGTFAPLGTTTPDESPVAWASLNSGQNPAKTGVPGFIKRDLGRYGPMPATGHVKHEERPIEEVDAPFPWSFLGGHPPAIVAIVVGLVCVIVFAAFFALVLRMRKNVAFALAIVLGGIGAWAGDRASRAVPRVFDDVVGNPCEVGGFWEVAARAGVPSIVLEGGMTWDRPHVENARVLSGLGVPDVRSANCDWFLYTTGEEAFEKAPGYKETKTGGKIFRLEAKNKRFESRVYGPLDLARVGELLAERRAIEARIADRTAIDADHDRKDQIAVELADLRPHDYSEEPRLSLPLVVEPGADKAKVTIGAQAQEIALGQWSKWYSLTFEVNALIRVRAITRVKLVSLENPLELFVDSLQIDPGAAPFWQPISQPRGFASELASAVGSYETVGWGCLTMPFKDKEIDVATFLEDVQFTQQCRTKLLGAALLRDDWRVLMSVESTPDRVQHMLYQYYDAKHPSHDPAAAAQKLAYFGNATSYADVIPATYREMDRVVGEVLAKHVRPEDTLIVCSDHGFQSFRRQFHLNNWLAREGYLVLRDGITSADDDLLSFVDWTRTKAYALGLGAIYLNLKGREAQGIVEPSQKDALLDEIAAKLLLVEDGGERAVHDVQRTDRVHAGPHLDREADLMPGLAAGWRVSWKTTRGGIGLKQTEDKSGWEAGSLFVNNTMTWSGDHVSVASALVPGVFLCNKKVELPADGVHLLDVAPTVLSLVGVPIPPEYDRPPLKIAR